MGDSELDWAEILVVPLDTIIASVAGAVAQGQAAMDSEACKAHRELRRSQPEIARLGHRAPWYQLAEVEAELRLVVHYEQSGTTDDGQPRYRALFAPYNAKCRTGHGLTVEDSSRVKLTIVPVPPPVALTTSM